MQEADKMIRIAIDGPAGAGKSSVAKMVAKRLSIEYVDTGAMYRAVAYYMILNRVDIEDEKQLLTALENIKVDYKEGTIYLNGKDVEGKIRQPEVTKMATAVSALFPVRQKLVAMQKEIASKASILMDGRDIGTNVIKDAELKIFLTATAKERAERRYKEFIEKGISVDYDEILKEIFKRDEQDQTRSVNPLRCAEDAVRLQTDDMTKEEVVDFIVDMAEAILRK